MIKSFKSVLIFLIIFLTFIIQPCYALGFLPLNPRFLPQVYNLQSKMGPAKVVFSPHRSIFPSEENVARKKFSLFAYNFGEGSTLPARIFYVRLKSQHLSPILETCIQTKKETLSGSVLRLQDIQELRTCVFLRKHSKNASHFCEPDSFAYDQNSNLVNLTNPANQTIDYTYDALNRLTGKTGLTGSTDYTYDLGSRLTGITGSTGPTSSTYIYDTLNRITSNTQTVNSQPYTLSYQYDQIGNRTQLTYPSGTILTYAYDELNRLTDINNLGNHFTYTYDVLSRRTKLDMPNTAFSEYVYDNLNRLLTLRNKSPRYRYIPFALNTDEHRLETQMSSFAKASEDYPPKLNVKTVQQRRMIAEESSNEYRSSSIEYRTSNNICANLYQFISDFLCKDAYARAPVYYVQFTGVFSLYNYVYDDAGNRTSALHQIMGGQVTENYGYDDIYQLTNLQSPISNQQFDYDSVGNREVVTQNGTPTNYTANNLNQYSQVGTTNYQYDAKGNLTNDGINTYVYDVENRLTGITGQTDSTYSYDGLGRRVSKNVNGTATYFVYDGDRIIEERDSTNQLIASYVYGVGIDEILQMNRSGNQYYYHYDGLGSVSDITDTNGYVVENYSYDVYGQPSQLSTIGNRNYFTGREYDEETGLYYYRARYYSPTIGRFLQRDPYTWGPDDPRRLRFYAFDKEVAALTMKSLGIDESKAQKTAKIISAYPKLINHLGLTNPQNLHSYLYCFNSPVNWVDPSGLFMGSDRELLDTILIAGGLGLIVVGIYPMGNVAVVVIGGVIFAVGLVDALVSLTRLPETGEGIATNMLEYSGFNERMKDIEEIENEGGCPLK